MDQNRQNMKKKEFYFEKSEGIRQNIDKIDKKS